MGRLYLVATPIGNLLDMSFRAVETLKKVALIAAEDTRRTRKLLDYFEIKTPMTSYYEHNEKEKTESLLDRLGSEDVALVSDAGTPGVSDPGYKLVSEAISRKVKVVPVPGPSALVAALVASGLPTDKFVFLGFLPKQSAARKGFLGKYKNLAETLVFYESPYRLIKVLSDAFEVLGERQVCIAREMSKKFEEFIRLDLSSTIGYLKENKVVGEVTVVMEGNLEEGKWIEERVKAELNALLPEIGLNKAAKRVAKESGWSKGDVYRLGLGG